MRNTAVKGETPSAEGRYNTASLILGNSALARLRFGLMHLFKVRLHDLQSVRRIAENLSHGVLLV